MSLASVTKKDLIGMSKALDTAIEDSWEWSKYSDSGDASRSVESDYLCQLLRIVSLELAIRSSNKGGKA